MTHEPHRTPARAALHDHLERLRAANDTAAAAQQPFQRAADQIEHAETMVRNAESALAAFDAAEAEKISKAWPPSPPTAKAKEARSNAEDSVAHARRVLAVAQQAMEGARVPADQAAVAVRNLDNETAALVDAVLVEIGRDAIIRMTTRRAELVEAESAIDSVRGALISRQDFRGAEALSSAVHATRWPDRLMDAAPYHHLAERLRESADAVVV